ncbi:hypothetical protein HMPREF3180_01733 [Leptotrichia wadei]|uniref:Uncharacterized protein n=1 Tax=Leptotrichia wadei TaxID=157687 RepID=A0A134A1Y7_9FUSO|nr:hypothetical protein HMPREF3180_01733 [Leptotrichia wadei]
MNKSILIYYLKILERIFGLNFSADITGLLSSNYPYETALFY